MKAFVGKKYYLLILVNVFNSTILKWLDIFLAKFLNHLILFFLSTNFFDKNVLGGQNVQS